MALATTSGAAISALMSNPQVRKQLKILGKNAFRGIGRGITRRIQKRRMRRGRPILFPGLFGVRPPLPPRNKISKTINVPVRKNVISASRGSSELVCDEELTSLTIPVNTDADGDCDSNFISPTLASLWPKLHTKCKTFSRYSVEGLTIVYTPAAGGLKNGTLWMGWTNNVEADYSEALNTQSVYAMPVRMKTPISQPCSMNIPTSEMCRHGRELIIDDDNNDSTGNGSMYYPGLLCYTTSDVDAGTSVVGTLSIQYRIRLMQPQPDISEPSSVLSYDESEWKWTVEHSGDQAVHVQSDSIVRYASTRTCVLFVVQKSATLLPIHVDAIEQTPVWTFSTATDTVALYSIPHGRGHLITMDRGGDARMIIIRGHAADWWLA